MNSKIKKGFKYREYEWNKLPSAVQAKATCRYIDKFYYDILNNSNSTAISSINTMILSNANVNNWL